VPCTSSGRKALPDSERQQVRGLVGGAPLARAPAIPPEVQYLAGAQSVGPLGSPIGAPAFADGRLVMRRVDEVREALGCPQGMEDSQVLLVLVSPNLFATDRRWELQTRAEGVFTRPWPLRQGRAPAPRPSAVFGPHAPLREPILGRNRHQVKHKRMPEKKPKSPGKGKGAGASAARDLPACLPSEPPPLTPRLAASKADECTT
jgi:hypothetical protein